MRRLAHWSTGAVLADDMGLGKTIQALSLLLHRAPNGPALVIAPTSVGINWQREAARSIGMSRYQELRYIVLPQAMRKVMPPMANQFISLVKDSSLVSLISVPDLTFKTVELVASTRLIFEAWLTAAAFYFVICFGLSLLFRRLERR